MIEKKQFTVHSSGANFDGTDTNIPVEESIEVPTSSGELDLEAHLSPTSQALHFSGGRMYYGNVEWPTRMPDVAYWEDGGTYDVRLQNEYKTTSGTMYGPYRELKSVSKVLCAWHLEVATHVFVNDGGWVHYKRVTPSEQGLYLTVGDTYISTYIYDEDIYESEEPIENREVAPGTSRIREEHTLLKSNTNRPLEVTSKGFSFQGDESVEAVMEARLSEEEGLRSYRFYVATDKSIYAVEPNPEGEGEQTMTVSTEFGVAQSAFQYPVWTSVPQAVVLQASNGPLYVISGRKTERVFPEGAVPWAEVFDIEYHVLNEELAIATDEGVWFYDWNRQGIFRQYDVFVASALVYDENDDSLLAWDNDAGEWKRFDQSGSQLTPSVTTQMIESGGRELEIVWIKTDYETSGYDNTDKSTFPELWHTVRNDRALDYSQDPDAITGTPEVSPGQSAGATSIPVATGSSDSITLRAGDHILFQNHDEAYEVASDVSISSNSSGTISLRDPLEEDVPSETDVRVPYRGILKVPAQERIQPPFRGKGHQLRLQDFDSLRDIQILARPRINYE